LTHRVVRSVDAHLALCSFFFQWQSSKESSKTFLKNVFESVTGK
jgi:hypothetical protein